MIHARAIRPSSVVRERGDGGCDRGREARPGVACLATIQQ